MADIEIERLILKLQESANHIRSMEEHVSESENTYRYELEVITKEWQLRLNELTDGFSLQEGKLATEIKIW